MLGVHPYSRLQILEGIIRECIPHVKLTGAVSVGTLGYSFASYLTLAIQIHYDQPEFPLAPIFSVINLVGLTILDTDFHHAARTLFLNIVSPAVTNGAELLPISSETYLLLDILMGITSVSDPE